MNQVLCSRFTLNSDLQTYSYTSDCSALLSVLILCSVLLDSYKKVTYFQRDNSKNITNKLSEQESNRRYNFKRESKWVIIVNSAVLLAFLVLLIQQ